MTSVKSPHWEEPWGGGGGGGIVRKTVIIIFVSLINSVLIN